MKKFRKTIAFILTAMMVTSMFPVSSAFAADFGDTNGHWAEGTIDTWAGHGVLNGADGKFRPDAPITRAELAAVLNRVIGYNLIERNPFSDVATSDWFYQDVVKLNSAGVMIGADGYANPQRNITREEAAVLIGRAFEVAANESGNNFPDAARVSNWAVELVGGLKQIGYISGKDNGYFEPTAHITRAEAVKIIDNIISAFYAKAGEFSENASGNAVVRATGVTLANAAIGGKLYIMEGVGNGDVTLDSVTVSGETYVRGGGDNTVRIKGNSKLNGLFIRKREEGAVRVLIEGSSVNPGNIKVLEAVSGAYIEGSAPSVSIEANVDVTFRGGVVDAVAINANGARVVAEATSQITKVNVVGDNVTITGAGKITNVYVDDGEGVTVTVPNATVTVSANAGDVKTGNNGVIKAGTTGKSVVETGTATETTNPGGGSSGGGGTLVPSYTINSVGITSDGGLKVESTLIAQAKTSNNTNINTGVSYKWLRADKVTAAGIEIAGATGKTYKLTDNDLGKFIKVVVTGSGSTKGSAEWTAVVAVAAKPAEPPTPEDRPELTGVEIEGAATVGTELKATVKGKDKDGKDITITNGVSYQWQVADTKENDTWVPISGADKATYTIAVDVGKFVRLVVTGDDKYVKGEPVSTIIGPVEAPPVAVETVTISAVSITGTTTKVGSELTAKVTGAGIDNLAKTIDAGDVTYVWQRGNSNDAATAWAGIDNATASTYAAVAADAGKFIRVVVSGVAQKNTAGTATSAAYAIDAADPEPPTPPTAKLITIAGVEIVGDVAEGSTLTAAALDTTGDAITADDVTYIWSIYNNDLGGTAITQSAVDAYTIPYENNGKWLGLEAVGGNISTTGKAVLTNNARVKIEAGPDVSPTIDQNYTAITYSRYFPNDVKVKVDLGKGPKAAKGISAVGYKVGDSNVPLSAEKFSFSDNILTIKNGFFQDDNAEADVGAFFDFTIVFNDKENTSEGFKVTIKEAEDKQPAGAVKVGEVKEITPAGGGGTAEYLAEIAGAAYKIDEDAYNLLTALKDDAANGLDGFTFNIIGENGDAGTISNVTVAGDVTLEDNYTVGATGEIPKLTIGEKGSLSLAAGKKLEIQKDAEVVLNKGGVLDVGAGSTVVLADGASLSGTGSIVVEGGSLALAGSPDELIKNDDTTSAVDLVIKGGTVTVEGEEFIGASAGATASLGTDGVITATTKEKKVSYEIDGAVTLNKSLPTSDTIEIAKDAVLTIAANAAFVLQEGAALTGEGEIIVAGTVKFTKNNAWGGIDSKNAVQFVLDGKSDVIVEDDLWFSTAPGAQPKIWITAGDIVATQGGLAVAGKAIVLNKLEIDSGLTVNPEAVLTVNDTLTIGDKATLAVNGKLEITKPGGSEGDIKIIVNGDLVVGEKGTLVIGDGASLEIAGEPKALAVEFLAAKVEDEGLTFTIDGDVEVAANASLVVKEGEIVVGKDGSLVVNGILEIAEGTTLSLQGDLEIKSTGVFEVAGRVELNGESTLNIAKDATLNLGGKIIFGSGKADFVVDGTLNLNKDAWIGKPGDEEEAAATPSAPKFTNKVKIKGKIVDNLGLGNGDNMWSEDSDIYIEIEGSNAEAYIGSTAFIGGAGARVSLISDGTILLYEKTIVLTTGSAATLNDSIGFSDNLIVAGTLTPKSSTSPKIKVVAGEYYVRFGATTYYVGNEDLIFGYEDGNWVLESGKAKPPASNEDEELNKEPSGGQTGELEEAGTEPGSTEGQGEVGPESKPADEPVGEPAE
ncbi:MAG: S-layer homology domain-containing protein [Clostridiales Family XIII bacterium]|jgi:hypothetical protein|nr:S-layer homology domain-containing protein [Clostridiales Family XIII bacterium]